ncbi:MAG: DNA mismatch repair protein MutT [Rubellimicrobium sp.]|nr:DNA mismatch repair protein MutT [Rubellimicrobium sp.]
MVPDSVPPIRDAATVILVRQARGGPRILMGQRGSGAVFMPGRHVFPGGAVEPGDAGVPLAGLPGPLCRARLAEDSRLAPATLAACAIRELWEETGLALGRPGTWPDPPPGWQGFAARRLVPDASALSLVYRAVTPPGFPRRFDARFFLADADALAGDADDLHGADGELGDLHWVAPGDFGALNLARITRLVLDAVAPLLDRPGPPATLPFRRDT